MTSKHTHDIWTRSTAKGSHKLVLLALADRADDRGEAQVSLRRLAELCGLSLRSVRGIIDNLTSTSELRVMSGSNGAGNANTYWLPPIEPLQICVASHNDLSDDEKQQIADAGPGCIVPRQAPSHDPELLEGIGKTPFDIVHPENTYMHQPKQAHRASITFGDEKAVVENLAVERDVPAPTMPRPDTIRSEHVSAVLKAAQVEIDPKTPLYWSRREHREQLTAILAERDMTVSDLTNALSVAVAAGAQVPERPKSLAQVVAVLGAVK